MKNYILYENGYAKTFYRNLDENIAEKLMSTIASNQELKQTELTTLPPNELPPLSEEDVLQELRMLREEECFSVINRGALWYEKLSAEEFLQLREWYQKWLDVTTSKVIPDKPAWLN